MRTAKEKRQGDLTPPSGVYLEELKKSPRLKTSLNPSTQGKSGQLRRCVLGVSLHFAIQKKAAILGEKNEEKSPIAKKRKAYTF